MSEHIRRFATSFAIVTVGLTLSIGGVLAIGALLLWAFGLWVGIGIFFLLLCAVAAAADMGRQSP